MVNLSGISSVAKQKNNPSELAMRKSLQMALFSEVNQRGVLQKIAELELGFGNALLDGAVWRKFGKGDQMVSLKTLFIMIDKAEDKKWCDLDTIYASISNTTNELELRDDLIIEGIIKAWMEQLELWMRQIEDMVLLSKLGSIDNINEVVKALEDAIKRIRS